MQQEPHPEILQNKIIPVLLGTGRVDRQSEKVARYIHAQLAAKKGIEANFVDVCDHLQSPFTVPAWIEDENASMWRKIALEASGFIFVVPEYNHSFPGEFKLLLDSAFKEYANKPAIVVGVSTGQYGGVRVIEHLAPILASVGINVLPNTVATAYVKELFDESGQVNDEKYIASVNTALDAISEKVMLR